MQGISIAQLSAPGSTVELFEVQGVSCVGLPPTATTLGNMYTAEYGSPAGNGGTIQTGFGYVTPTSSVDGAFRGLNSGVYYEMYATGSIGGCSTLGMLGSGTGVHSGGANYLAADGHVKFLLGTRVSGGVPPTLASTAGTVCTNAAGTGNMLLYSGGPAATLTFSAM